MRSPDLSELETLVICASEGTFAAAAERLNISRPAVAKRISNLETLAGRPLFERGSRGIRLTDAGASLLAGARRILGERDLLLSMLSEIRGEEGSSIAGLRGLLGHATEADRAAQRPEARLSETERLLEFVLRSSATSVVISDPETSVIHEVNDAFCRFVGRPRKALIGSPATETWFDPGERPELLGRLRTTGTLADVVVRVERPDGVVRVGEAAVALVSLAGSDQLLATIDDITERRRAEVERAGTVAAYSAITALAVDMFEGRRAVEGLTRILAPLRECGEFASALLWDPQGARIERADGAEPWPELADALERSRPIPASPGVRLLKPASRPPATGYAVSLPQLERSVILLSQRALPESAHALVVAMLDTLGAVIAAGCR